MTYDQLRQFYQWYEHTLLFCMMFVDITHVTLAFLVLFFFLLWRRASWHAHTQRMVNQVLKDRESQQVKFEGQRLLDAVSHMHVNSLDQISQIVQAFTANKDE